MYLYQSEAHNLFFYLINLETICCFHDAARVILLHVLLIFNDSCNLFSWCSYTNKSGYKIIPLTLFCRKIWLFDLSPYLKMRHLLVFLVKNAQAMFVVYDLELSQPRYIDHRAAQAVGVIRLGVHKLKLMLSGKLFISYCSELKSMNNI